VAEKICDLLDGLGIGLNEGEKGKSVCQLCTLIKCIYDKPGRVSEADRRELKRILNLLKGKEWEAR